MGYCDNVPMGVRSPMSKTRSNMSSEGKFRDFSKVSNTIDKEGIKRSVEYYANVPIKVSSPKSNTRLKQYIEEKWGDHSNVLKIIKKQDTEELWYMVPMGK